MAEIPHALAAFIVGEIRRGRAAAGMTQEAFGRSANFSPSHVSSVENGTRALTMDFIRGSDRALGTGGVYERLVINFGAPAWLREWIEIEREAIALRWYEQSFVPGLLQTEDYARATLSASRMFTADEVEQRVATRMQRQQILTREKPPQFVAVLDEAVLRRTVDDRRDLMAAQLEHLVTCADMPNVQIHLVPAAVGLYPGLAGSFILAGLASGATFGHLDHQLGAQIVERGEDVARLASVWDVVMSEALPRRQSLDTLKEVAKTWT
ncbi:helix-turn-helix transcriptional regulator [Micromonospora sp. NPDC049559]|uniref:helix-turn-helix domain-containing protein n=1 Tax=Micromonospora sp. NPDC049559 TaxID=3155923 RepID=UPI00343EE0E6